MITQRSIDEWHVEAQDYRDQIRDEFLQGLMGNRPAYAAGGKQPQMMQQGQQSVAQQPMMQPQQMQQAQMPQGQMTMGGKNVIENAQPLCKPCNSSKGTKYVDYRGGKYG